MKKTKISTFYVCDVCGHEHLQWQGKCDSCSEWGTLKRLNHSLKASTTTIGASDIDLVSKKLSEITYGSEEKIVTSISELDRVLGGGIVRGSLILIGGEPGVGKSTLLLQMGFELTSNKKSVLYVSGEESESQIKSRANRIPHTNDDMVITTINEVKSIASVATKLKPDVLIIDSIQSLVNDDYPSSPGSVVQLRESALVLQTVAKRNNIAIFLVGHITKQGTIAGPKVLEHIVDTVLTFDSKSDQAYRLLRADKNRFGDTSEVGVFAMHANGFESVSDPSSYFLSERNVAPGSCLTVVLEGRRPIILEVQALANKSVFGYPKRTASGFDPNRLQLMLAIIERHLNIDVSSVDVYVNIVGGLKVREPSVDLAVCAAVISSIKGQALPDKLCLFGEVGLTGEVRKVFGFDQRIKAVERLGYQTVSFSASLSDMLKKVFK